jgi:hypothetical protein
MKPYSCNILVVFGLAAVGLTLTGCQQAPPATTQAAPAAPAQATQAPSTVSSQPNSATSNSTQNAQSVPTPSVGDVVRNGMLTGHNSTTVGKAFEGTFQTPKWTSFDTPKGATVVEFDGTISYKALKDATFQPSGGKEITACQNGSNDAADACIAAIIIPVRFQFTLSADKGTFEISYLGGQL